MSCINLRNQFIVLVLFCLFNSFCFSEETKPDPNSLYKVGGYRDIKILTPKQGFKGAPSTAAAYPSFNIKIPSLEEDFDKKYVRITVLETKKLKNKNITRVGFSLDEIDPNGNYAMYPADSRSAPDYHKPVYYAALFIKPNGIRIRQIDTTIYKDYPDLEPEQDVIDAPNGGYVHGIYFPLTFTFPPKLSPHKNMKENSYMAVDNGVVYHDIDRDDPNKTLKYTMFYVETPENGLEGEKITKKYFSKKENTLSDKVQADSIEVAIRAKETQTWADDNDWLWKEMERTDADGNVTMRCKRLK
jgi:hypothetical protein